MRIEGLWRIAERKTSRDKWGSAHEPGDLGLGDTELGERLRLTRLRNRDQRGHASREAQEFQEIDAAAVTGGQGLGVEVEHHREAGALLPEQKQERLVVLAVVRGRLDEGHRTNRRRQGRAGGKVDEGVARRDLAGELFDGRELRCGLVHRFP